MPEEKAKSKSKKSETTSEPSDFKQKIRIKIKAFDHLIGNYGGAWQDQKKEFDEFGGPILATTNCVLIPRESYKDRLYTTGITRVEGVKHLADRKDFSEMIEHAKRIGDLPERKGKSLLTGFHHNVILDMAPTIVDAIKAGAEEYLTKPFKSEELMEKIGKYLNTGKYSHLNHNNTNHNCTLQNVQA